MRFVNEIWLYLIPVLPLLWVGLRAADRRAAGRLAVLLGPEGARHREQASPRLRTWRRFLAFAGVFWLMLALAQPQWGAREVAVTQRGSDIVVALDISNSMLAEDVPPNRMESAKGELNSFLKRLENSRVGLVFFAGSAFVQCPLTLDYGTAEIFLRMAGPDMMSEQGTNIAAALETSRMLLAKGRGEKERSTFQAILLVTDGEDLEGAWEDQAEACGREGIKVIPVGVGEETGGLIPVTDRQGRPAGFMKDDEGNLVMSRLDLASLEKMAGMNGGSTFRIGVDGLAGDRLFSELQRLGRRDLEERRISSFQDRYIWPLGLALIFFLLEMVLFTRVQTGPVSRRSLSRALVVFLALALSPSVTTAQVALRPPGAGEAEQGRRLYLEGRYEEALQVFQEALVLAPDDPKISLAVGETLHQLQRYDEAQAEFERARQLAESDELKAEALYNSGTSRLAAGDVQNAVEPLMESLKLQPESDDALYNLEVALRRLQEQQQQEQQQQQDQDQQEQEENQEEEQNQDQQDQQKQDEQENQEQQQQEQQQDQPQENPEQQEEQEQQPQPQEQELTREQAEQILKALDRDEEELKRSVQKRLKGGRPKSGKRW